MKFAATLIATAQAANLAITWSDCGDASTHAKVTDLQPTTISTGGTSTLQGTGDLDEVVNGATFTQVIKADGVQVASCSGDASQDVQCKLPLGVGSITLKAQTFPLQPGQVTIPVDVKVSSLIPASLAKTNSHIEAVSDTGDKLFCMDVQTSKQQQQPSFAAWAETYGFNSADTTMEEKYNANVAQIDEWNADPSETAIFAVNQFSGMTYEEFAAQYLTAQPLGDTDLANLGAVEESEVTLADVDWSVTPVKNQGSCGSCWAFGTMGSIEHVHKLNTGSTVNLAEQQLVDCDKRSSGCNGGRPDWAMNYLAGKSIYTTSSYPYTARDGSCRTGSASGVTIGGYKTVSKSDSGLASALGSSAVTVMVYADSKFQSYSSGILSGVTTTCSLNHAVLATGYGSNFWKIKNSWGTSWGEAGYIRFQRTTSGCGPFGLFYDSPVVPTGVNAAVEV